MDDSSPMQESGTLNNLNLKVNTSSLEKVLISIHQSIKCHENALIKLPEVEATQSELRKELKKLQLALESIGDSCGENNIVGDNADDNNDISSNDDDNNDINTSNSYGVRTSDIEPIYRKHSQSSSIDSNKSITNSLREIKSAIRKVQDEALVNSAELEEGIKSLKDNLFKIQQKLASSVSVEQLQTLQRNLLAKYSQLENNTQDIQTNLHNEIDTSTSSCNGQIIDLEVAVKQRHTKLEQRVLSCAKELDVADLKESLESDIASLSRTLTFLDDTAKAQGKTFVRCQQKNAIAMFHRHYTQWKQKQLLVGLSRWKKVVQRQKQLELNKEKQKSQVRKTLTNIISRRKRIGFDKWIRYRDWHRNVEQKKLRATTLLCERLGNYLSASKIMAFNKWRRVTLMNKMKCSRDVVSVDMTISESTTSTIISTSVKPVDLDSILDVFGSDVQGSTYALASEIQSTHGDIASLRQNWCDETQRLMSNIKTSMDEAIRGVEDAANTFQESISRRVDGCANELPVVHSKLKELSQLFERNKTNLNKLEQCHKQKIDLLVEQEQKLEQRLCDVEASAKTAHNDVTYLFEEQAKSDKSIQELRGIIVKNEETRHEESNLFQQALDHFGDELLKTKVTLGHTRVRCESVEKELVDTKSELNHLQHACQVESERTQSQLHHPGIPKPSLDRIVGVGHAFESLAQDKKYVTGINVCATLRTTSCSKMTTKGEQVRHEEEVDVPSEIVAFAHDYAAFVAYQADHESILRLIAGGSNNIDDQVYAEDDMLNRRKELCSDLKTELTTLLEKASTSVFYVKNEGSSRGLGLRWEARAVFLPKVVASLEAALSKHDQIILPAATRLGRVRPLSAANVTVCVACDRPMRRKTARTPADGEKRKKKTDMKEDIDDVNVEEEESLGGLEVGTASKVGEVRGSTGQIIKKSGLANAHKENSISSNFFDDLVTFN